MKLRVLGLLLLAIAACARPATRTPTLDMYADDGPLRVRGARASAPGPAIYRALGADARRELAGRGEPDTIEVVRRGKALRVVLTYPRGRRRVVIVPKGRSGRRAVVSSRSTRQRSTVPARPPATIDTTDSAPALATEAPPPAGPPPAPPQMTLTARQALECAIDAERDECRSVCADRADYEWCR
jgi:hypothetical protein